jgi:hypothetical protein
MSAVLFTIMKISGDEAANRSPSSALIPMVFARWNFDPASSDPLPSETSQPKHAQTRRSK